MWFYVRIDAVAAANVCNVEAVLSFLSFFYLFGALIRRLSRAPVWFKRRILWYLVVAQRATPL